MAKSEMKQQSSQKRQNRFLLLLLVGAALVSAASDVVRLHDFASGVVGLSNSLHQTMNTAMAQSVDANCPQALAENDDSAQPFYWNGRVAPEQLMKTSPGNGVADTVPAVSLYLDVAFNQASRSKPAAPVQAPAPGEIATAQPPLGHSSRPHTADRDRSRSTKQHVTIGVRDNQDEPGFTLRVAPAVAFAGTTMDDFVIPRIDSHFVNERVSTSTGYTQAKILSRRINARLTDTTCPQAIRLKTARRIRPLDLFQILRARIEAEGLTRESVPDAPRTLRVVIQRAVSAAEDVH
jgi:hypothetical protein